MSEPTDVTSGLERELRIVREDRAGAVVLRIGGEVDAFTVPRLTNAVADVVAEQPRMLVLDLSAVGFLASAGLSALLTMHRDVGDKTVLRIVADGRATLRPIHLTGLDQSLPLYPTLEASLAGL
ncbi:STAS domain-containing protein [Amycolatopsis alkalitolerans]|uniref:Anti-sigma factor antagonist n=1 Tax=Amycolatopsis alkalitolerans TaxID=2547244 RepID=A0A5C4LZN8_9PSEU|nr:STAS domain-containing protein [Amycolatopsis alkalitolerans]TNC23765.1 STAS domain-containing protein [Amycolatopsis alkalitolerans]